VADTLDRIAGPQEVASGTSTLFTGTAAHVYTIKHMTLVNPTAGAITVKMGIQASAGTLENDELILPEAIIDPGGLAEWSGLLVLTGTEVVRATASAAGLTFTMSGLDQG
jgi:hypothetical protein